MEVRELIFKAKRLDNGEWITGYYALMHGYHYIMPKDDYSIWYEINPDTICQYTGLTDKNGNKIWENDIVRKSDVNALGWSRVRNCKVSFDEMGYWLLTTEYGDGYWLGEFAAEQIEVIGNIFDNPELLERMG